MGADGVADAGFVEVGRGGGGSSAGGVAIVEQRRRPCSCDLF